MSYNVKSISVFERQSKRLLKKFPTLKKELQDLVVDLKENPIQGSSIGNNCFKIRLAVKSKGKGKSGGMRVITHVLVRKETLYLLSIYDKSDMENISDNVILELLKLIPE